MQGERGRPAVDRSAGDGAQASLLRRQRLIEDALADALMMGELASATLRVAAGTLERGRIDGAVRRLAWKPQREHMVGHVERHLRRKALEDLLDLMGHRKSRACNHTQTGQSFLQSSLDSPDHMTAA
jgi:hypothetical protein